MLRLALLGFLGLALVGCGDDSSGSPDADVVADTPAEEWDTPSETLDGEEHGDQAAEDGDDEADSTLPPTPNWERDIEHLGLTVDLAALTAEAEIVLAAGTLPGASFEAAGLTVTAVTGRDGPVAFEVSEGRLDLGVPASAVTITVAYGFVVQPDFEGWSRRGFTLDWPTHCGNLFPCHSSPSEGQTFALEVTGVAAPQSAIFPDELPTDAPAYQIAWAVGEYESQTIGLTSEGTEVVAWTLPGGADEAAAGMADVPALVGWYERTLGPYPFGDRVGAIAASWPPGAYGGMEHHPYWHVSVGAMSGRAVHAHEASHGWFGDGVRIARWEDLVLSEGTASYLQARSLGQVVGPDAETAVWDSYAGELEGIVAGRDRIAWPDPIADPDELNAFLFSRVTYIKGAFFYRAVAEAIGAGELDRVLSVFFAAHVGEAAGMQDLLDLIEAETDFDPTPLAEGWLRSLGRPDV